MPIALAARAARAECLAGILYKNSIIIPYFAKKIKRVSRFFREIFDFLIIATSSRGIVESYMRGCACRELVASSFSFGAASITERMSLT